MKKILFLFVILVLGIETASSESGVIEVNTREVYNYNLAAAGGVFQNFVDFNTFKFDNADYRTIVNMTIQNNLLSFANQSNVTHFSVASGGTGSGYVSYSNSLKKISWVFTSADITSSTFTLSYDSNIFAGAAFAGNQVETVDTTTSSTQPFCLVNTNDNRCSYAIGGGELVLNYGIDVSTTVENQYNVSYPISGYFQANVTKVGQITQSRICINSTSASYFCEPTVSLNHVFFLGEQLAGIYINITLANGEYQLTLINSSGISAPPPDYGVGGSQNGQMNFDTVQPYFKGYFGINITMNSTTFDSNKRYFIDVFKPDGTEKVGFPIEISSATYTTGRSWVFDDYGLWNATLTDCNQFNFLCGATGFSGLPPSYQELIDCINNPLCGTRSSLVDVAIQVINVSEYTYSITSESTMYATNDTIHFNITSTNPAGAYFTILDSLGNVVNPLANNVLVGEGVTLYNVTIPQTVQKGNYTAILALNQGYFAQVKSYNFAIGIVPGRDSISWGDNNIFGYTNTLSWSNGVSDATKLNYITVSKLINDTLTETSNFTVNNNSIGSKSYLMDTVGFWSATIHNTTTGAVNHSNISVFASSVGLCNTKLDDFVCFNNQSYYPGDTYTINYQTKSLPDCFLTGPCIPPFSKIVVKVLNPNAVAVFNKTLVDCTNQGGFPTNNPCHYSKPLIGSAISMFKASAVPGTYQVLLVLDRRDYRNNSDQVIEDVIASNTAVLISKPIATPAPPTGQQGTTAMGNNLLAFMYVPAFWGVILWFSVVVITASSKSGSAGANTGVVALAAALLLSIVGLFDPYRWFVLAGLIVITGIYFMIGRNISSGDT